MAVLKKDLLKKKAAALKKELFRKSNFCDTLRKFTLKKFEEVAFPKKSYSKILQHMGERKLPLTLISIHWESHMNT